MSEIVGAILLVTGILIGIPFGVSLELNSKVSETEFWKKLSIVSLIIVNTLTTFWIVFVENQTIINDSFNIQKLFKTIVYFKIDFQ